MESLAPYLGTPAAYAATELAASISGGTGRIKHELETAMDFWNCPDLTPQEKAAAHFLAVISNHRAISWWREPATPDGTPPLPALEPWQDERLCNGVIDAARAYAVFIPERQAAAIMALVPEYQPAPPAAPVLADRVSTEAIPDPERRLARLRALGGSARYKNSELCMNILITIDGREAVPVRAIPLLTDWQVLSPDVIANALAGDDDLPSSLDGLSAYRLNPDGSPEKIPPRWWENWVVRKLQAISDEIKGKQITHETGYQQWRCKSLAQLPAGVFVWRDEFETAHIGEYGPGSMRARCNPDTYDPSTRVLNFNPQPDPDIASIGLVLEGLEAYSVASQQEQAECASAFDDWEKIDQCKSEIARWERLEQAAPTPSEAIQAEERLMALRQELKQLLELVAPAGAVDEPAPVPSSKAPDLAKLATREQLIAAFGNFTGMSMNWFNNLKDTPVLSAARKITGQGGRGRIIEPLFCPYEVMLWLASPKRRKGRKLGIEKAWKLLEENFPMVYAAYSVGDPRQPD